MKRYSLGVIAIFAMMSVGMYGYCRQYKAGAVNDPAKATPSSFCSCKLYVCASRKDIQRLSASVDGSNPVWKRSGASDTKCPVCGHDVSFHNVGANLIPISDPLICNE